MAEGLIHTIGKDHELRTPAPEDILDGIDGDVAVVMLTQVDYRTGRLHDMAAITQAAHAAGAVMIWDLAHSVGALPIGMAGSRAEFAVGCTYKYLNGGPGAPAFIHVRPDIAEEVEPALAGWLGHDAPFAMERSYRPAMSTERLRVGTPPVVQMTILDRALDVWEGVDMTDIRAASVRARRAVHRRGRAPLPRPHASPRNPGGRGSQVSFAFEYGYPAMQALIDRGVIGDFRAPDIKRFGFTPLYVDEADVLAAAETLETVIGEELWRDPKYQTRSRVT